MTEMLATTDRGGDLVLDSGELSRNPAAVYLASLAQGSRRAMVGALGAMAGILQGKGPEDLPSGREEQLGAALACQWGALRYQHTAALRARLAEAYSAATANRMLSALRGVLTGWWKFTNRPKYHPRKFRLLMCMPWESIPGTPSARA